MNFNVVEFLDMLIKAPTLFVYSIFKWGKKIDPHKMFLTCVLQEVLILLFFIVYITTPGFNVFGVFVFIASFIISLAIDYVVILGMPDDKDYWMYIITGNLTEDLYRRATKSKALSAKLGIEYKKGKKKKTIKEQPVYEDVEVYDDDLTKEEYKEEVEYNDVEYFDEDVKSKINVIETDNDIVEHNDVSVIDDAFNNASVVDDNIDEDETNNEGKYETSLEELASIGEQNTINETTCIEDSKEVKEEVKESNVVEDEISKVSEQIQEFSDNFESKFMDNISRTNKFGSATKSPRINIQMDGYENNGEEQTMKVDDLDEI